MLCQRSIKSLRMLSHRSFDAQSTLTQLTFIATLLAHIYLSIQLNPSRHIWILCVHFSITMRRTGSQYNTPNRFSITTHRTDSQSQYLEQKLQTRREIQISNHYETYRLSINVTHFYTTTPSWAETLTIRHCNVTLLQNQFA